MVCAPHWDSHARDLMPLKGRLSVGLHLDLTSPWALRQGHGMGLGRAMAQSLLRLTRKETARRVIAQQLDRFEQVWQAAPDHIDGHQHVQQFAVWREALVSEVENRYPLGQRPWLRVSRPMPHDRGFKSWLIGAMGANALSQMARQAQIPCAQYLVGITDFRGDAALWLRQVARWLDWTRTTQGVVMMCHPGMPDADSSDAIADARAREWSALSGPHWPALLQAHGVTLSPRPEVQPA
jgi:predicted glycoside hydrolase/deacetylase ChbG (UPF0249 family)